MSDNQARVSVRILEKEYHITCPIEERSDLLDSAEFLNSKMREIRDSGKVVGLDRIAVIAALNMANELIRFRNRDSTLESDVGGRLRILRSGKDLSDFAEEVSPFAGTLLAFRRCENSWHGHEPFEGPRRAIQLNWVVDQQTVDRELARHRVSAFFKKLNPFAA